MAFLLQVDAISNFSNLKIGVEVLVEKHLGVDAPGTLWNEGTGEYYDSHYAVLHACNVVNCRVDVSSVTTTSFDVDRVDVLTQ